VGSVTAARRPILPLHHFVGGKIGRRGQRNELSTPGIGEYRLIFLKGRKNSINSLEMVE